MATARKSWATNPNHPPDVYVGIDLGTSAGRAAFKKGDEEPRPIPMGKIRDPDGRSFDSYMLSVATLFTGPEKFQLLLDGDSDDPLNTSPGAKQALDADLCKDEGQGQRFRSLCNKYKVDKLEVVTALLEVMWGKINEHLISVLSPEVSYNITGVTMTVPVTWTIDDRGERIQRELAKAAEEAGFPGDRIVFDTEPGSAIAYIIRKNKIERRRRVLLIDVGAGTVDFAAAEIEDGRILLIRDPVGCSGGMADGWAALQTLCLDLADKQPEKAQILFQNARNHVYKMSKDCKPYALMDYEITAESFQNIIGKSYEKAIEMGCKELESFPGLDAVIVSGSATASNEYIKDLWASALERSRKVLRKKGWKADFDIEFLDSETAAKVVSLGAAIPQPDDALAEFRRRPFGFLCYEYKKGRPPTGMTSTKRFVLEVKEGNSEKLEKSWEKVQLPKESHLLPIEPHYITNGTPLDKRYHSSDTGRPVWPCYYAMPMNPIELNLEGLLDPGAEVLVRFTRTFEGSTTLRLEIAKADCTELLDVVFLKICLDRDRLFFREVGRRSRGRVEEDDEDVEDLEDDERDEDGEEGEYEEEDEDDEDEVPYEVPSDRGPSPSRSGLQSTTTTASSPQGPGRLGLNNRKRPAGVSDRRSLPAKRTKAA